MKFSQEVLRLLPVLLAMGNQPDFVINSSLDIMHIFGILKSEKMELLFNRESKQFILFKSPRDSGSYFGELESSPRFPGPKNEDPTREAVAKILEIHRTTKKHQVYCNNRDRFPQSSPISGRNWQMPHE